MFKIHFNEKNKSCRTVLKEGNSRTLVHLKAEIVSPIPFGELPGDVRKFMLSKSSGIWVSSSSDSVSISITVMGVSKCSADDEYNSVFGEEIAELRALCSLYKFLYSMLYKLASHYSEYLYGKPFVLKGAIKESYKLGLAKETGRYKKLYELSVKRLNGLLGY